MHMLGIVFDQRECRRPEERKKDRDRRSVIKRFFICDFFL